MSCWTKIEPDNIGTLFPTLNKLETQEAPEEDDASNFKRITASFNQNHQGYVNGR